MQAQLLLGALRSARDEARRRAAVEPAPASSEAKAGKSALDRVDLSQRLDKSEYEPRLEAAQHALFDLGRAARERAISSVLVFEGWDAAGKGGAIRRLAHAFDPRALRVVPIAAPTSEERAHPWLWRFWRHLPRAGRVLVFDRSWYGRVLVERVEGFAQEEDWRRAYEEIVDFERCLVEHGCALVKFWLHIDPDEQLRRFEERERTPHKRHKITPEDYRNRERWSDYERAVDEMLLRTSTAEAPWTVVGANDKRWARVRVLESVRDALEQRLGASSDAPEGAC